MHVLVVIDGLGFGGAEMLLADLVRSLSLVDVRVSVAYLREKHGSPAAARLREVGIEPVGLEVGGLLSPRSLLKVRRHVAEVRPDVVHTQLGYSDMLGGLAAAATGIPVVSTIHLTRWDTSSRERVKLRLFDVTRRLTCSRVIVVSEATRAAYLRRGFGPRARVVTVHNCIAGRPEPGAGRAVREELGIGPDELVVGMVSVLRRGKGHDVAARAIQQVRERRPGTRLIVAGDGPARDEVQRSLEPLGDAALLIGHRDDVMGLLDAYDLFLLPSEHEAFPTALLEAMAAGVPIVASAVGGVPEIVQDGVSGRLVESPVSSRSLAQAIGELLGSSTLRAEAGAAGRRRFVEAFSLERWGEQLRTLYEEAVDRPAAGQALVRRLRKPREAARRGRVGSITVHAAGAEDDSPADTADYRTSHLDRGADYDDAIDSAAFDAYMARVERDLLVELVTGLFAGRIPRYLDFACGTGRVTEVLAPLAVHSVGVDVSPSMLKRAREKCPTTEFVLHDLTRDPLLVDPFDLVTAFRFLGNAQPALRSAALRALHDLVRPGGYLVVNNHRNPASVHNLLLRLRGKGEGGDLTLRRLRALLAASGFELERAYGIGLWAVRYSLRTNRVLGSSWSRRLERLSRVRSAAGLCPDMVVVARRV